MKFRIPTLNEIAMEVVEGNREKDEPKNDAIDSLKAEYLKTGDEDIVPVLFDAMMEKVGDHLAAVNLIWLALERAGVENMRLSSDAQILFSIPDPPLSEISMSNFMKIQDELERLGCRKTFLGTPVGGKASIYASSSFMSVRIHGYLNPEEDSVAKVTLKAGNF